MNKTIFLALFACAWAPQAKADSSDSGNWTIGGQAVIGGTMTVQGNAFSVGGSTLSVFSGAVGVGTTSPASKLDVHDGSITLSSASVSGTGIVFPDGSMQTKAAPVSNSSSTLGNLCGGSNTSCSGSNTSYGSCVVGSTLTITTGANPVAMYFNGYFALYPGTGGGLSVLIDGAFPASYFTVDWGITDFYRGNSAAYSAPTSGFYYVSPPLSAGSHSFCLTAATTYNSGAWSIYNQVATAGVMSQFGVVEVH